ncbi:MAG: ABC transporter substrate-binding protein [Syntrophales bacterium]|jgi:branched-chain amino acid transport system substrate-binding protein|nr:ABC transporter substrate-binding protein [Syntrophales bacterium]MDY0044115.1 ABC transporter substrate-binding protein [Syntrophales bacterium]
MRKRFERVVIILICCMLCHFWGGSATAAPDSDEVKIGVILPLTGPQAPIGREVLRGIELATEMVNDMGGIWNGKNIYLLTGDAANAESARTETERLITVEKVKLLIGVYSSSLAFVVHPIADKYNAVFWETNAIADRLRQMGHENTYFFGPMASGWGEQAADCVVELMAPKLNMDPKDIKIAVVYQGTEWGKSLSHDGFIKRAKELGLNIVIDAPYDPNSMNFSSLILKIKRTNPDIVHTQNYLDDGYRLFRDARKNGLNPKIWVADGCPWAYVAEAFQKFGTDMNYVIDLNQVGGGIQNLSPTVQSQYKEFLDRYQKKYKTTVSAASDVVIGYSSAMALYEYVLPEAGSLDPERIKKVATDISLPATATVRPGGIKFDPNTGQNTRAGVVARQIFNKQYYAVWPKAAAELDAILPIPPFGERAIDQQEVDKRLIK